MIRTRRWEVGVVVLLWLLSSACEPEEGDTAVQAYGEQIRLRPASDGGEPGSDAGWPGEEGNVQAVLERLLLRVEQLEEEVFRLRQQGGSEGPRGAACFDGLGDVNEDGTVDVADCRGEPGPEGPAGSVAAGGTVNGDLRVNGRLGVGIDDPALLAVRGGDSVFRVKDDGDRVTVEASGRVGAVLQTGGLIINPLGGTCVTVSGWGPPADTNFAFFVNGQAGGATGWVLHSSRSVKQNIRRLSDEMLRDLSSKLDSTPVYFYTLRDPSVDQHALHVGLVAEDAPPEILVPGGKAIDTGDALGFLFAVAKDLHGRLREIEAETCRACACATRDGQDIARGAPAGPRRPVAPPGESR